MEKTIESTLGWLKEEGFSDADIGRLVGCSGAAVHGWRVHGVTPIGSLHDKLLSLNDKTAGKLRKILKQASQEVDRKIFTQ
ncbi:MAG: hypothetical protein AAB922_03850 [Patescibacteria group bacterium]